jgi:hypothetical protein
MPAPPPGQAPGPGRPGGEDPPPLPRPGHEPRRPRRRPRPLQGRTGAARLVEERTQLPAFCKDFPTDVSPLTRQHRTDPRLAERWDLVAFGTEPGTAYSELTDPVEQRRRLTARSLLAAGGDPEAMEPDEDFLDALEYAVPPPAASPSASTA